jgi:hypothetical protein
MSDASLPQAQTLVTELKVSGHLMLLDTGVYCVFHTPGGVAPDSASGLPGARISLPPGPMSRGVTIKGFSEDGWLGSLDSAALIRVASGPAQVLVTVYQQHGSAHEAPKLQVMRLTDAGPNDTADQMPTKAIGSDAPDTPSGGTVAAPIADPEIAAHVQARGDILARIGDWVGEPGSQRWVEGFAVSPRTLLTADDIEYQAVLGRGWLSPWAEGGQYCGSRGMALPILGLRVRLRNEAARTHQVSLRATFTDGTEIGPVGPGEPCEAPSLAPLEAFQISLTSLDDKPKRPKPAVKGRRA